MRKTLFSTWDCVDPGVGESNSVLRTVVGQMGDMCVKVQGPTADLPDAEEMAVWNAVLASLWVS